MKRNLLPISACTLAVLPVSIAASILTEHRDASFQVTASLSIMAALFNILAVPLFLKGTQQFTPALRRAYIILCIGVGVFGLAQIQLPLINQFGWGFWINSGGLAVPYLAGVIGIFWGMRVFAILLDTKGYWTSPIIALTTTFVVAVIGSQLPHVPVADTDELTYDLSLALSIWNSVFITFATIAAFKIRQKIGNAYLKPLNWLTAALVAVSFAGWHYSLIQLVLTTGDWYYDYSLTIVPFVASALLFVVAGYTFSNLNVIEDTATAHVDSAHLDTSLPPEINIILYVAGLASSRAAIDADLDDVRLITAGLQPNQALSPDDKKTLAAVYSKLEHHLTHDDPLRKFSKTELRQGILKKFNMTESQLHLWENTPA